MGWSALSSSLLVLSITLCCLGYRIERYDPPGPSVLLDDGHTHYGINIGSHLPVDEQDVVHSFPNEFFFFVPESSTQEWTSLTLSWASSDIHRQICASVSVDAPPILPSKPGSMCGPANCGNHALTVKYPVRGQWNVAVYACDEGPLPFSINLTAQICNGKTFGVGCQAQIHEMETDTQYHGQQVLSAPNTLHSVYIQESTTVEFYSNITVTSNSAATPLCLYVNYSTFDAGISSTASRSATIPMARPVVDDVDDVDDVPIEALATTIFFESATRLLLWYGACADPFAQVATTLHYNLRIATIRPTDATCNPFGDNCDETIPVQNIDVLTGEAFVTGTLSRQLTWYGENKYYASAFTFTVPGDARYVIVSSDNSDLNSNIEANHCAQFNHITKCDMYPTTLHNLPSGGQWSVMVLSESPVSFTLTVRVYLCASDCNNNGVCNAATSTCICDDGYVGYACDQPEYIFMNSSMTLTAAPHKWHYYEFDVTAKDIGPVMVAASASIYTRVFPFLERAIAPNPQESSAIFSELSNGLTVHNAKPGKWYIGLYNRYFTQQSFTVGVWSGVIPPPKETNNGTPSDEIIEMDVSLLITVCVVGTFLFSFGIFMTIFMISRYTAKKRENGGASGSRKHDSRAVPLLNNDDVENNSDL